MSSTKDVMEDGNGVPSLMLLAGEELKLKLNTHTLVKMETANSTTNC